jgi:hypothetical protein
MEKPMKTTWIALLVRIGSELGRDQATKPSLRPWTTSSRPVRSLMAVGTPKRWEIKERV